MHHFKRPSRMGVELIMSGPYRENLPVLDYARPNFLVRWWYRWIGKLVYTGKPTCGHCKYWKPPSTWTWDVMYWGESPGEYGDCKLLYGTKDTGKDDTCDRFAPRRRYKHREKKGVI
jgi:hypothetical protein